MPERCLSCDAEVIFVPSGKTGRRMILNAEPAKGVVVLAQRGAIQAGMPWPYVVPRAGKALMVEGEDQRAAFVVDVYTDHHATCTHAPWWEGRTRSNPPKRRLAAVEADPQESEFTSADPAMAEAGDVVIQLPTVPDGVVVVDEFGEQFYSMHCKAGRHGVCLWIYGGRKCACECGHPLVPDAPKSPGTRA